MQVVDFFQAAWLILSILASDRFFFHAAWSLTACDEAYGCCEPRNIEDEKGWEDGRWVGRTSNTSAIWEICKQRTILEIPITGGQNRAFKLKNLCCEI